MRKMEDNQENKEIKENKKQEYPQWTKKMGI